MTPSQAMKELARILSASAGFDAEGDKIRIIDKNNKTVLSDTDEDYGKDCDKNISKSFIRLRPRNSPRPSCRVTSTCRIEDLDKCEKMVELGYNPKAVVQVTLTAYEMNMTATAVRCDSWNILHAIRAELDARPFKQKIHPDIKEIPIMGDIIDVSAFSASDDFQDRAEATITFEFCDRTICLPNCKPFCIDGIIIAKNGQTVNDLIAERVR